MSRANRVFPEVDNIAGSVFSRSAAAEARVKADKDARTDEICSNPVKLAAVARVILVSERRRNAGLIPAV